MFVIECKVKPKPQQIQSIDEAIRTSQFVRNKVLRYWMDNRGVGKTELFRYNTRLRKEYKFVDDLNSHACQTAVERVLRAINKFFDNCKKKIPGKKGYPKFKQNTRSVEYKVSGWKLSENRKHITFTDKKNIGKLKLIGTRDLNYYQIEQIKRVRIIRRADGYYVQFSIHLDPRDRVEPLTPSQKAVGVDVGLKYFYADSQGNIEPIPQFYRKAERQLNKANRKKSKKFRKGQKPSQNYHKARNRSARKHLKVSRQREEFAKRKALRLIQSNDLIAYEDLNVKSLVKNRHLAKSISDVGWSLFRRWLEYFGYKYGKVTVAVPPHNTSQNCSSCGQKVQKSLSTRTHVCSCGCILDRDVNAALNILQKGLSTVGHTGSKAFESEILEGVSYG
ncbi:RNA-guided endonuclease InsQ/TnpB family protein [Gloeothece verrucosa]|uniref:RNA-guided endonuclease InsQ/TnpB family protein n=1 Tax=Gloeothece verrucosa TaxID=2546359 RepID=UPI00017E2B8B|nr:RNA-guided endonuclease TnpB family protein [Gloeothece verrucosa]